jgi:hypothetical protein
MNYEIKSGEPTDTESKDILTMLKLGDGMSFKNDISYKLMEQELDIYTIKVGVKIEGRTKGRDFRYVDVLFNRMKKVVA